MASPSHSSWNRTWEWLREVDGLRQSLVREPSGKPSQFSGAVKAEGQPCFTRRQPPSPTSPIASSRAVDGSGTEVTVIEKLS
jgi:hypothetical protein